MTGSCTVQLGNVTDEYVAFKVKTTAPRRYCIRPDTGVILPQTVRNVTVTIMAPTRCPADLQCKDKILVRSVIAPTGATDNDVTRAMFKVKNAKLAKELNISVVYVPAKPPVPEGDEEATIEDAISKSKFSHAVNFLSKLRHPNLVTVIEACPEACGLLYFPNGSLEDRLNCKDNTLPLSWKTRISIAAELCSTLIFLHSCSTLNFLHSLHPRKVVHGDLKPSNILLDSKFTSKLNLSEGRFLINNSAQCGRSESKNGWTWLNEACPYIDPEFLSTGELSTKSDVFSFGIILLRLLTGRQALGIANEVQDAFCKANLKDLLDPKAGDWPYVQLHQLAHVALRCTNVKSKNRPDLVSARRVLNSMKENRPDLVSAGRVLNSMKGSSGISSLQCGSSVQHCQVPAYFVCPIFMETMKDPVIAADGFSYEAEAIKRWLSRGHDTSPMTNVRLSNFRLVPNRTLLSAIQEWHQQHPPLGDL